MTDTKDSGMHFELQRIIESIKHPCTSVDEARKHIESYMQSRIAEAEERQRERCKNAYLEISKYVHIRSNVAAAILNAGGQDDE